MDLGAYWLLGARSLMALGLASTGRRDSVCRYLMQGVNALHHVRGDAVLAVELVGQLAGKGNAEVISFLIGYIRRMRWEQIQQREYWNHHCCGPGTNWARGNRQRRSLARALIMLGKVACRGDEAAKTALLPTLRDPSAVVRAATVTALGKIAAVGNAYTVHALCNRIKDPNSYVRSAALSALTRVAVKGDLVAVAAVEDCLKTETKVREEGPHGPACSCRGLSPSPRLSRRPLLRRQPGSRPERLP